MTRAAIRHRRLAATALVAAALFAAGAPFAAGAGAMTAEAPAAAPSAPATPSARTTAPAPFTNEDIVRLVVNGTAEAAILREIAARPPDYDLDPGVVAELERVGVSRTLIEAMRRRMLDTGRGAPPAAPSPHPPPQPVAPADQGTIVLGFAPAPGHGAAPEIFAIARRPESAGRPDDGEVGLVDDLALALMCTSATHVPDHWDTRTPIEGGPRHELLLFRPGSHHRRERGFDLLVLDRAVPGPLALPAGRHALLAGLAGRHGSGAWRLVASDALTVEVEPGGTLRLSLDARSALRGSRMAGYRVEQVFTLSLESPAAPPRGIAP